jgi:hypothetical protein
LGVREVLEDRHVSFFVKVAVGGGGSLDDDYLKWA